MPDVLEILKITVPVAGSVLVAWLTGRASARREQGDLAARVAHLEEQEPAEVAEARREAKVAAEAAVAAQKALADHVAEEKDRRRAAARAGEQRDAALAKRLDDLVAEVREQGGDIRAQGALLDVVRDYVLPGDSRRGR